MHCTRVPAYSNLLGSAGGKVDGNPSNATAASINHVLLSECIPVVKVAIVMEPTSCI